MQETRQNRIARLLQKELSLIFQSQTRAMHGIMVSVTRCRVSPDLSICTAYLSIFPSEKPRNLSRTLQPTRRQYATNWALAYATSCASSPNSDSSSTTRSTTSNALTNC